MDAKTINLLCSVVALLAGVIIFGRFAFARWRGLQAESPHFRKLQHAFRNREWLHVAIGPVDEDVIQLGLMRVDVLSIDTDHASCSTTLETTLTGSTLVVPLELSEKTPTVAVSVVDPESAEAVFASIEKRAERARENTTQAS